MADVIFLKYVKNVKKKIFFSFKQEAKGTS